MKRSRIKPRSKKRPAWENEQLRFDYLMANGNCELAPHLVGIIPGLRKRETASEVHHLLGSRKGRHDLTTNLIAICRPVHLWMHANEVDGRVLALSVKFRKGELDWDEFETASGYRRTVVCNWRPTIEAFVPPWTELVAACEQGGRL
jgi:hypothetical protein